jgi:ATP-dependent RNA helicase DHX36
LARFPKGVCPKKFLGNTPDPPSDENLDEACNHLLEVDAVRIVSLEPFLYRLTPLGYHLSRLPMDTKVGKVLVVGCMLGCLDGALTVAASLSCTKSCFLQRWGNGGSQFEASERKRSQLIESGFGGKDWRGGASKGDLIATIAVYMEWSKRNTMKKGDFCHDHALDNLGLKEISQLRSQFLDCLLDAGFVSHDVDRFNGHKDDALLTSCCFVAGLYPNICTLVRPRKGGPKGGRLLTKDGDTCRPQSSSFQRNRIQTTAENGRDAYAVYHAKHRSVGTGARPGEIFLSEVSFVSRMALLLFGGELEVNKNAVIVDGWLKFKIGDKGIAGAVMLLALRDELDSSVLRHILSNGQEGKDTETLIAVVRQLLSDE